MKKDSFLNNPKAYTLSALIIGYLLTGDLTAKEQNALGNWLMAVGQILAANATVQSSIEEKYQGNTYNINSKQYKSGGSAYMDNEALLDHLSKDQKTLKELKEMIKNLEERLNRISN